jgi:hypothetical protein
MEHQLRQERLEQVPKEMDELDPTNEARGRSSSPLPWMEQWQVLIPILRSSPSTFVD